MIAQPVESGNEEALTPDRNSFPDNQKSLPPDRGEDGEWDDLHADYRLLEPNEIDPAAGQLPPALKDELQAAVHARLRGFPLIQLSTDGTPAVSDWRSDVLTSDAVIRGFWSNAPKS